MKSNKIRFTSALCALVVAGGITFATPTNVYAEENKQGEIQSEVNNEVAHYNTYTVKKGDNLSRISGRICDSFGKEYSGEYWPVLAFLNGFPRVLQPNDVVVYPETFEEMVIMNENLKAIGWTARYIQRNKVYEDNSSKYSVLSLLYEIYGDDICIDADFVNLYLNAVGVSGKYDINSEITDTNQLFELTDWIPTLEELNNYRINHSKKSK